MNDYQVVVEGLRQMLAPYGERVHVVEVVSLLPVETEVDVLRSTPARFVLYTWNLDERSCRRPGQGFRRLPVQVPVGGLREVRRRTGPQDVGADHHHVRTELERGPESFVARGRQRQAANDACCWRRCRCRPWAMVTTAVTGFMRSSSAAA
ncbi:MAG: hypothetical protein GEU96_08525 [Propionibacteriales bacterium]|nr:hypothetical protein [Propionibacteriales bacterium]